MPIDDPSAEPQAEGYKWRAAIIAISMSKEDPGLEVLGNRPERTDSRFSMSGGLTLGCRRCSTGMFGVVRKVGLLSELHSKRG
jgi:hypothetical protein